MAELAPYSGSMTTLQAVNILLRAIGQAPVNTLIDGQQNVDTESAYQTLQETSREVQSVGWHWNTEEDRTLDPDTNGIIALPANVLKVDTTGQDYDLDLVQRGLRLYDRMTGSFSVGRAVTVDLVLLLPFEDLPQEARFYIAVKAARSFATRELNSDTSYKFTARDEQEALTRLQQAEAVNSDANLKAQSPFFHRLRKR